MASNITEFYSNYCKALEWALSIVPKVPKRCRRHFEYEKILEQLLDEHKIEELIRAPKYKEISAYLEAISEALALIEIFKRFESRRDPDFKTKLREIFFGPIFTVDEDESGNINKNAFGRNILSELIFACKFKNSKKVSFQKNDLIYDMGEFKIGIEVKRIQKPENITDLFADACKQLQSNPSIKYGIVALRLDKYYFTTSKGKIIFPKPILLPKQDTIFRYKNNDEAFKQFELQTRLFHKQYDSKLLDRINITDHKNILGYSVFTHNSALTGAAFTLFSADYASHQPWERISEPKHKEILEKFKDELEFH